MFAVPLKTLRLPAQSSSVCATRPYLYRLLRWFGAARAGIDRRAISHFGRNEACYRYGVRAVQNLFLILTETGIRCGEAYALPTTNLLLVIAAVKITQKVWHGQLETVKSKKGNRLCEISPQLVEHLRGYLRAWRPNCLGLLFATKNGTPWDADVVRKRKLYPLLQKLNIRRCGFHAFRHGNETVIDGEHVPKATRINRLGHSDARMTMRYTHLISEDGPAKSRLDWVSIGAKPGSDNSEVLENVGCGGPIRTEFRHFVYSLPQ